MTLKYSGTRFNKELGCDGRYAIFACNDKELDRMMKILDVIGIDDYDRGFCGSVDYLSYDYAVSDREEFDEIMKEYKKAKKVIK